MIKLIDYQKYVSREVFISKTMIHSMQRENGMTRITMQGGCSYTVKETPEEILAMPDIETTEKVIDWEQRRYEIAKSILGIIFKVSNETDDFTERECIAETAIRYADALIKELKKGGEK